MKWNVDKALTALVGSPDAHTSITQVMLSRPGTLEAGLGPLTLEEATTGFAVVWRLRVGLIDRNLSVYGRTIHGAYQTARRAIKRMAPDELRRHGLTTPRQRSRD